MLKYLLILTIISMTLSGCMCLSMALGDTDLSNDSYDFVTTGTGE